MESRRPVSSRPAGTRRAAGPSLSFRAKLLLIIGAVTVITQTIQSTVEIGSEARRMQEALHARVEAATRQGALSLATAVWELNRDGARQILNGLALDPDFQSAAVTDQKGAEFVRVSRPQAGAGEGLSATAEIVFDRGAEPLSVGTFTVTLSRDRALAEQRAALISRSIDAAIHFVAVFLATLIGIYLITSPLERITAAMLRVARGQTDQLTPFAHRRDQLGALAQAVEVFRSEIEHRKKVEQELRSTQAGLEARIDARTAELRSVNDQLMSEVAERERAEAAVRKSEQLLRSLLEHLPAAIVLKGPDGRILLANELFAEIYGPIDGAAVGQRLDAVLPADIRPFDAALEREVLRSRKTATREMRSGERWLAVTKFPMIDARDSITGLGTVTIDVTERRRIDDQLREAQKLESIGQLTGGIAHDFNNLLIVILGHVEIVLEQLAADSPARRSLETVFGAAQRGASLTRQLLAFARRQPLVPESIDTNALIRNMIQLLSRSLGEVIKVETRLADRLWMAEVDPNQLESAILNLAINSRDAMPKGGTIGIETANVILDSAAARDAAEEVAPGPYVMVVMRDTGAGMPPEVLSRAFEPFFTTKPVGRGTGLGLSMVYGFIRQSGGHIRIDSTPGHGTSVVLYLPKSPQPAEAIVADDDLRPQGTERVLVVEDDADVRTLLVTALIELGYTVRAASDGREALAQLATDGGFDLLLTDVMLPGEMTGRDLTAEARKLRPALRAMYVSGYPTQALSRDGRMDEDVILLPKPFTRSRLARAVRSVLEAT
jgi:PAS domain S-box-containing protein